MTLLPKQKLAVHAIAQTVVTKYYSHRAHSASSRLYAQVLSVDFTRCSPPRTPTFSNLGIPRARNTVDVIGGGAQCGEPIKNGAVPSLTDRPSDSPTQLSDIAWHTTRCNHSNLTIRLIIPLIILLDRVVFKRSPQYNRRIFAQTFTLSDVLQDNCCLPEAVLLSQRCAGSCGGRIEALSRRNYLFSGGFSGYNSAPCHDWKTARVEEL